MQKKLAKSPRSQKEIAAIVGYKNHNMITMLKQGDSKLALDRVPAMAKALDVDPLDLFKIALTQFYDDKAVALLVSIVETGLSPAERKILQIARDASGGSLIELTPEREAQLTDVFASPGGEDDGNAPVKATEAD